VPAADVRTSPDRWLLAAALYNLLWGALVALSPRTLLSRLGVDAPPAALPAWRCVGMMVLAYAPAYAWAARDPVGRRHIVAVGLLGKVLGPLGFAWAATTGALPLSFGWTILANDLLWWPAFARRLSRAARATGGWGNLLRGA
jgi:hypothetical protein